MGHDATKVLMGTTLSNVREVSSEKGEIEAGLAVCLESDGSIGIDKDDGSWLGISLGKDQSDTDFTAIARKGLKVPIQLTAEFTPTLGAQVYINKDSGKAQAYNGSGAVATNAVYASGVLTGMTEAGSTVSVALIDMIGGL